MKYIYIVTLMASCLLLTGCFSKPVEEALPDTPVVEQEVKEEMTDTPEEDNIDEDTST
jgi:PBP1b-binding outer membrane lipoprotein LpoB